MGAKQGGTLSPKLFVIYVESAIVKLLDDNKGCKIGNTRTNEILFADDTVLLYPDQVSLQNAVNTLDKYCAIHDIIVNVQKTKYMTTDKKTTAELTEIKLLKNYTNSNI
jgi:hypothetical protein